MKQEGLEFMGYNLKEEMYKKHANHEECVCAFVYEC